MSTEIQKSSNFRKNDLVNTAYIFIDHYINSIFRKLEK